MYFPYEGMEEKVIELVREYKVYKIELLFLPSIIIVLCILTE